MSQFCLGTVQFGMKYGVNNVLGRQPNKRETYDIIREALQLGIKSFDTASVYGEAEKLLGNFSWEGYNPKIISKLSPNCIDDELEVKKRLQDSLRRLNVKRIYGYMLHRYTDFKKKRVMSGLIKAKESGWIEKIGISVYEPQEAMQAVNDYRIDIIQVPYNVFDQRLDDLGFFLVAKENKKEVYVRSVFLQGLLSLDAYAAEKKVTGSGRLIDKFKNIINKYKYTSVEAAMLYVLYHENIEHVVFGVDTVTQLRMNISLEKNIKNFRECYGELYGAFVDIPREILIPSLWR